MNDRGPRIVGLRVGVLGTGLMGGGIAAVFAAAGAEVTVHDPDPERLATLTPPTRAFSTSDEVEKARVLPMVGAVGSLAEAAAGADLVVEAAPEDLALKRDLFAQLDAAAPADAILATNSSAISPRHVRVDRAGRGPARLRQRPPRRHPRRRWAEKR